MDNTFDIIFINLRIFLEEIYLKEFLKIKQTWGSWKSYQIYKLHVAIAYS